MRAPRTHTFGRRAAALPLALLLVLGVSACGQQNIGEQDIDEEDTVLNEDPEAVLDGPEALGEDGTIDVLPGASGPVTGEVDEVYGPDAFQVVAVEPDSEAPPFTVFSSEEVGVDEGDVVLVTGEVEVFDTGVRSLLLADGFLENAVQGLADGDLYVVADEVEVVRESTDQ